MKETIGVYADLAPLPLSIKFEKDLAEITEKDWEEQEPLAQKTRQVWAEAKKILGGIPSLGIKSSDPKFAGIFLYSQQSLAEQTIEDEQPESNFDFLIVRAIKCEGNVSQRECFRFFATFILKDTLTLKPNSAGVEKEGHVTTVEELSNLLQDLQQINKRQKNPEYVARAS